MSIQELTYFENKLYSEWKYYENKYADEDIIKEQLFKKYGEFDIYEVITEVDSYIKKKTYYNALFDEENGYY